MLSLILPTYNESKNIEWLVPKLHAAIGSVPHEILVVDDNSPDKTWEVAERAGARAIRRIGRRGLSSAVIEGFHEAKGDVLAVMDADGQHDESILLKLVEAVEKTHGVAVGSRYVSGGAITKEWSSFRRFLSKAATKMTHLVSNVKVTDPMSGFFVIDRKLFLSIAPKVNVEGFKILLEILAHLPKGTPVTELPFTFGVRTHGHSKLTMKVQLQFGKQLLRLGKERIFG